MTTTTTPGDPAPAAPGSGAPELMYHALVAVRLRVNGSIDSLRADLIRIVEEALQAQALKAGGRRDSAYFDVVRVDGKPAFEVEIRAIVPPGAEPFEEE